MSIVLNKYAVHVLFPEDPIRRIVHMDTVAPIRIGEKVRLTCSGNKHTYRVTDIIYEDNFITDVYTEFVE